METENHYICEFCKHKFSTRTVLANHKARAKYCIEIQKSLQVNNIKEDFINCTYCSKPFSADSIKRHETNCKIKKQKTADEMKNIIIEKDKLFEEYKIKIIQLEKENEIYKEKLEKLENTIIGIAEAKQEILNSESFDNQIEELTLKYGGKKKQQRRQQIKEPNVIYILTTTPLKEGRRYIFGKSKNLTTRLSTYNKTDEHEVIYYQACGSEGNMDTIEKMVLNRLEKYREVENRDRFILPEDKDIEFFINVIKQNVEFILNQNEN
jgi:hypothetical protein